MWRLAALAVTVLALTADAAGALEIKNVRSTYGQFGSVRPGSKFLPGDAILLMFDIEGLKVDEKTATARYDVTLELFDTKKERKFNKDTPNQQILALGGNKVLGYAVISVGGDQEPGKYSAKITVVDRSSKEKSAFNYDFDVLPADFGFIQPYAPSYGILNYDYSAHALIGGMAKDAKKMINVDINVRVYDEMGKQTLTKPLSVNYPRDLPEELAGKPLDYLPVQVPLFLSRVGNFRVEVEAIDNVSKKSSKFSFPLKVVDPSTVK
jgi:hypothetical protein